MSATVVTRLAATLSANHPLGQISVVAEQPDVMDPVASAQAPNTGALLIAGIQDSLGAVQVVSGGGAGGPGLTAAGVAAVLSAWNTYVGGLSAAKKAQIGFLRCVVTSVGLTLSVHVADAAAQAASLQTTLNNAANFGTVGS